jgi:hypothetical protein
MHRKDISLQLQKILAAGLTGTSFMTLFSYVVSDIKNKNFREPELLGKLVYTLLPGTDKRFSQIVGWNLHYLVGFIFSLFYIKIWEETGLKPSLKSALLLGALSGVVGLAVWKLCFKAHPNPPKISFRRYYGHLIATHLVFGLFSMLGYQLARNHRLHQK